MTASERLIPANPSEVRDALSHALRYESRKRKTDAAEIMAAITADELVHALHRAGLVIFQKAPINGAAAIGRGFEK